MRIAQRRQREQCTASSVYDDTEQLGCGRIDQSGMSGRDVMIPDEGGTMWASVLAILAVTGTIGVLYLPLMLG